MAVQVPIPVHHEQVFPAGAYVTTDVQAMTEYKDGVKQGQKLDKVTGELMWEVTVLDAQEDVKGAAKSVKVQLSAAYQPVPPEAMPGTPFRPVEFTDMSITPYVVEVMKGRWKVAYSIRARGMRTPGYVAHTGEVKAGKGSAAA